MTTPSEALTEAIIPLLAQSNLLLLEDIERFKVKFAAGSMKPEDWLLFVEKAMEKEVKR